MIEKSCFNKMINHIKKCNENKKEIGGDFIFNIMSTDDAYIFLLYEYIEKKVKILLI